MLEGGDCCLFPLFLPIVSLIVISCLFLFPFPFYFLFSTCSPSPLSPLFIDWQPLLHTIIFNSIPIFSFFKLKNSFFAFFSIESLFFNYFCFYKYFPFKVKKIVWRTCGSWCWCWNFRWIDKQTDRYLQKVGFDLLCRVSFQQSAANCS